MRRRSRALRRTALALLWLRTASVHAAEPTQPPSAGATEPENTPRIAEPPALSVPDPEEFGATARVEAPPREATKRRLERRELSALAGTRGDALRGVELLPGVSRPAASGGLPILRGANPFDSQVFLEGSPVSALYHVGGLTSVVPARVLDSVELYPSNFSVRYGRKMGGVIEARLRDPRADALHGSLDLNLLDSSLLIESPLTENLSVLASARRSNIDAVLNSARQDADFAITSAPVYWDYQSVAAYHPTSRDRIRVLAYGSSDRLALLLKKPSAADPLLRGQVENSTITHGVQVAYRHRFAGGSEQHTQLTYGRELGSGEFGELARFDYGFHRLHGRTEWSWRIAPQLRLTAGIDAMGTRFSGRYSGIPLPPGEGDRPSAPSAQRQITARMTAWTWLPAAYLELALRPLPGLLVTPGLRGDYNSFLGRGSLDPRLSLHQQLTPRTSLKAGIGKFTQMPNESEAIDPLGNPALLLPRALHVSAGVEHQLCDALSASVEGFVKWMDRVASTTPDGRAPYFDNEQRGRVYGAEFLLRAWPKQRFFGFVSYTLMRSERAREGEGYRSFDRDQTHILGASGVYRLGRGWEAGLTLRYTSGTPYTQVVSSRYEATHDVYLPVLGQPMSARNPAFSRLDARVQKTWAFPTWSFSAYLDVQNVLNAENAEGFTYNYDYTRRKGDRGLPILPILGIRGEL